MARFKLSIEVSYDDKLEGSASYVFGRIERKVNKILQEYSKEHFSGSFAISEAVIKPIKEKGKVNAKSTGR